MIRRANPSFSVSSELRATSENRHRLIQLLRGPSDPAGDGVQQDRNAKVWDFTKAILSFPTGNPSSFDPGRERNQSDLAGPAGLGHPNKVVEAMMRHDGLLPRSAPGPGQEAMGLPGARILAGDEETVRQRLQPVSSPSRIGPARAPALMRPPVRPGSGMAPSRPPTQRADADPLSLGGGNGDSDNLLGQTVSNQMPKSPENADAGAIHPRIRAWHALRKPAGAAIPRLQPTAEQKEAGRILGRYSRIDRGEPLDTSAETFSTARILRDYSGSSLDARARARDIQRMRLGLPPNRPLKGTAFFPGAGMDGHYIPDVVDALEEAGIANVRAVDPEVWSSGSGTFDAVSSLWERERDADASDFSRFGKKGDQFNLVGYSYGGLQAAQAAADYADLGGKVDHLVLMQTPIDGAFLESLRNHPNIGTVHVVDSPDQGDPIQAGANYEEFKSSLGELGRQSVLEGNPDLARGRVDSSGHFYYTGDGPVEEGMRRRRMLARQLFDSGLR